LEDLTGRVIYLYGRVQGVGFRYFTQKNANKLGLKGFVKNEMDGSVLIHVFGERKKVVEFTNTVKKGPFSADVRDYEVKEIDFDSSYKGFSIKY